MDQETTNFKLDATTGQLYLLESADVNGIHKTILKIKARDESLTSEALTVEISVNQDETEPEILQDMQVKNSEPAVPTTSAPDVIFLEESEYVDYQYNNFIQPTVNTKIITQDPTILSDPSNLHPPSVQKVHKFEISEGDYTNNHTIIGEIEVFDLDYTEESDFTESSLLNGQPKSFEFYNLTSLPEGIVLDKTNGEIVAAGILNFENINYYQFPVYISDYKYEVNTTIRIRVTDANECHPLFKKPVYQTKILENLNPPFVILKDLRAVDCDSAQDLDYHIVSHPKVIADSLYIDYRNFSLMSSTSFDRERYLNFTVSVTAVDTFNKIGSTQVIVLRVV